MITLFTKILSGAKSRTETTRPKKSQSVTELQKELNSCIINKASAIQIREAIFKLRKAHFASRHTPPKDRTAPPSEEEKILTERLKDIAKLLTNLKYSAKQREPMLKVFALMLSDNRENILKNMLFNNNQEGLVLLKKAFEQIKIPENHIKTAAQYQRHVRTFQEANFPGTLFKENEFGAPDFTYEEFSDPDYIIMLYRNIQFELNIEDEDIFAHKKATTPQVALKLLNQYILNNEEIFEKLINARRRNHGRYPNLSAKILNIDAEINLWTADQKKIFRNQIKYRNRLLLEFLFPTVCPVYNKIIYKQTLEEFKKNRLLNSNYKSIFNMKFGEAQEAGHKKGLRWRLFQEYTERLQSHAEIIEYMLTDISNKHKQTDGLLRQIQNTYFFPAEKPLNNTIKKILEPIIEQTSSLHGGQSIKLRSNVSEEEIIDVLHALSMQNFLTQNHNFEKFLWTHITPDPFATVYPELSSARVKSLASTTEKIELRSASNLNDILKSVPELSNDNLLKRFFKPLGNGKVRLIMSNSDDYLMVKINALEKNDARLGDITDTIGMCITVDNYHDIEAAMNCIEYHFRDFIVEKENLFAINPAKKAYRDVKYLIRLNQDILFEIQIKTIYEKVIGELLDHDTLYKNNYGLSQQEISALKPIVYGLMWARHLQLAEQYQLYHLNP